jgi:transposase
MVYPTLKIEEKRSCKLSDPEIKEIKALYKDGNTMTSIAKMYQISRVTVKYWVDEEYKSKDKQKAIARMTSKRSNPEKKKELNRQRADEIYKARHSIESLGKYHKKEIKELNDINTKTGRQEKINIKK